MKEEIILTKETSFWGKCFPVLVYIALMWFAIIGIGTVIAGNSLIPLDAVRCNDLGGTGHTIQIDINEYLTYTADPDTNSIIAYGFLLGYTQSISDTINFVGEELNYVKDQEHSKEKKGQADMLKKMNEFLLYQNDQVTEIRLGMNMKTNED